MNKAINCYRAMIIRRVAMPRGGRLTVPNCRNHIVQRDHHRKMVFVCGEDYQYYFNALVDAKI